MCNTPVQPSKGIITLEGNYENDFYAAFLTKGAAVVYAVKMYCGETQSNKKILKYLTNEYSFVHQSEGCPSSREYLELTLQDIKDARRELGWPETVSEPCHIITRVVDGETLYWRGEPLFESESLTYSWTKDRKLAMELPDKSVANNQLVKAAQAVGLQVEKSTTNVAA